MGRYNMQEGSEFLSTAIRAAKLAGKLLLDNLGKISKEDIGLKQTSDFVTRVDRDSEQIIIRTIREEFPDHDFLAEESIKQAESDSYRWIIDPLDGTTNYIHQYPAFSISIALEYRKQIITGLIYDPLKVELFTAKKGKGAFLNKQRISISSVIDIKDALITTGFPFRKKEIINKYLELFHNIFLKVSDLRRAGSAALDLAYLACGRCEGFFEIGLSPWDIAAGALLVEEAGGIITDFTGGTDYLSTGNIVAGNSQIQKELLKEIKRVFAGIIPTQK
jgi:myo-inositol-1(or 4)-monophosphatase